MKIKFVPNIFDKDDRQQFDVEYKYQAVQVYFSELFPEESTEGFVPIVSGGKVQWDHIPCKDDEIIFVTDLTGGSGGLFSGIIGAILTVAGMIIPGAQFLAYIGISMMAGAVVGALFNPSMPPTPDPTDQSPTYSWDGIQNIIGEGNIMPVVYGEHPIGGLVLEAFIDGAAQSGTQARQYLNALFAAGEGPIHGIDSTKVKIANKELEYYDDDIQVWTRNGTLTQSPIANFSKVVRHYAMQSTIRLAHNDPYIYKTYNNVDSTKVTLMFPALYDMSDSGDIYDESVSFDFYYAPASTPDAWVIGAQTTVTASKQSAVEHDVVINFPAKDLYLIKIVRTTANNGDSDTSVQDRSYLKAVSEIEAATLRYPLTALFGVRLKATDRLSGAMPAITAHIQGRKLADVRDGSETLAAAKNPANIIYDLVTNTRYGIARWYPNVKVNMASLNELADWADETVSHQKWNTDTGAWDTVTQKRYEINLVLDKKMRAIDAINKIANTCRAIPYWSGNELKFVIDRPQSTYAQLFSMGNIIRDSFEETYLGFNEIPNMVDVYILDEENSYKRTPIMGVDKSRLNEPSIPKSINLFGLTDKARAKREAAFFLKKVRSIKKTIKFQASIDAVLCEVGDLILFQHDIPQYGFGGRIVGIEGQLVYLDRQVPMENGKQYTIRIRKDTGDFAVYTVTAASTVVTSVIDVGEQVDAGAQIGDLWAYGEVNKEAKPFRVTRITNPDKAHFTIEAAEYNETAYAEDDSIEVKETNYSQLGLVEKYTIDGTLTDPPAGDPARVETPENGQDEIPPLVTDVTVYEDLKLVGNAYRSDIVVNFAPVELPDNSTARIVRYEVIYSQDQGVTWTKAGQVEGHGFYRIIGVDTGKTYHIHVKPYTNYERTNHIELSSHKLDNQVTVNGKNTPPMAPTDLVVTGGTFINTLTWVNPTDPALDYIEVWASNFNHRDTAAMVGTARTEKFTHPGLTQEMTYYYWLRAVDTHGNKSGFYPLNLTGGIVGTPDANPAVVLDLLSNSITEGQLATELQTKIDDAAAGATSQQQLLNNSWTVKIQENGYVSGVGLLLYESYDSTKDYFVGDYVWYEPSSEVYKCIADNPGSPNVAPPDGTYWQLVDYGARSEFMILADKFAVVNPNDSNDATPPFIVGTIDGVSTVGINGQLVIDGTITGKEISAQAQITLAEGGKLTVGNDNIILDSNANEIIVAPDGGIAGNDYCKLSNGEIQFYYWNGSGHENYKSLRRLEMGVAQNNTTVLVPGRWKNPPKVFVSPYQLQSYNGAYNHQDQVLKLQVNNLATQTGYTDKYQFKPVATLDLAAGAAGIQLNNIKTASVGTDFNSPVWQPPPNTRKLTVNGRIHAVKTRTGSDWVYDGDDQYSITIYEKYEIVARPMLYYKVNGSWYLANGSYYYMRDETFNWTINTPETGYDITDFYVRYDYYTYNSPSGRNSGPANQETLYVDSYTCDTQASSILATGWLNWMAIGE